jgi:hypothetical protein
MSECKVYRREIEEAADGGVMSGDARSHAALCRACGGELRERERLRALVGGLGKVEAPADFEFRLRARMTAARRGGGGGLFAGGRWLYGFAPVAVAACFVVVSATLYFRQAARTNPAGAAAVASAPASVGETPKAPPTIGQDDARRSNGSGVKVVGESRVVVNAPAHAPSRRTRVRAVRASEVASKGEPRERVVRNTLISSVESAPVLRPIAVRASAEPLRIILRDERGAGRVVPMRGVSFGSQDFLSREAAGRPPVAAEAGGVW